MNKTLKTHKISPKRKKIKVSLSMFIGKNFSGVNHLRAFVLPVFPLQSRAERHLGYRQSREHASSFLLPDNRCALELAGEEARWLHCYIFFYEFGNTSIHITSTAHTPEDLGMSWVVAVGKDFFFRFSVILSPLNHDTYCPISGSRSGGNIP